MKTLKLFNAVIAKTSKHQTPFISEYGYIIEPDALWAKDRILAYYKQEKLNGNDLNKTFHKSWSTIKNSSRYGLYVEQIRHYISTYGSHFQAEIYIPNELLELPEDIKLTYKVIKAYSVETLQKKCLSLLQSGIALKADTVSEIISVLTDELDYTFTGYEKIKNKEAIVQLAEHYGIYPEHPVEFLRYIIYRATGTTLLIKNDELIEAIKNSNYNPTYAFKDFGLERLAEIFNRFKPLFLAFKEQSPKTINKISKLSKTHHKPLVSNPLNEVTRTKLTLNDRHWLNNATPFALFKALAACYSRVQGQETFVYRIRNGKSWVRYGKVKAINYENYHFLLGYLKERFDLSGTQLFLPKDVEYALPTSEKMFVGNIPTGTQFYGKKLAVGIYWEDAWGARDLDLSGINIGGKIGWNATYNQGNGNLLYSGDMTSAPNGAVEYLYANKGLQHPTLIQNNVFSGASDSGYKIIIGKGDKISRKYMMNPNNLFAEIKCNSVQKQTILGMMIPEEKQQRFVLLNFGAGHATVSGNSEISDMATKALYQQWRNPISFREIVSHLGAEITDTKENSVLDFSLDALEKDSFTKLFHN
jgi:hypothetical protein